ncbi:MAG TPA: hypothetical protein VL995_19555 [Cellvibrio sp.]|nr:hypothetical protein [Cellvibrio sp.]
MTWIIEFKGDLSETSELNMDGSASIRAVSLVNGGDLPKALTNLLTYAKDSGISPSSIIRCEELSTFTPTLEDGYTSEEITTALRRLKPESLAEFTYAISSEAEADDEAIEIGLERESSK